MTFREIRNEKGYMPKWVLQRLKEKGIDLSDWQFSNRETQLYKQAGNSIVVNVLEAIFKELIDQ